jgi:hypothetical protein
MGWMNKVCTMVQMEKVCMLRLSTVDADHPIPHHIPQNTSLLATIVISWRHSKWRRSACFAHALVKSETQQSCVLTKNKGPPPLAAHVRR